MDYDIFPQHLHYALLLLSASHITWPNGSGFRESNQRRKISNKTKALSLTCHCTISICINGQSIEDVNQFDSG